MGRTKEPAVASATNDPEVLAAPAAGADLVETEPGVWTEVASTEEAPAGVARTFDGGPCNGQHAGPGPEPFRYISETGAEIAEAEITPGQRVGVYFANPDLPILQWHGFQVVKPVQGGAD